MSDKSNEAGKAQEMLNLLKNNKQIKGFAKKLTYGIIIISFVIGVLGSTDYIKFNMADYVQFLGAFAWVVVPLIISIGANSAMDKINKKDIEKTKMVVDKGGK